MKQCKRNGLQVMAGLIGMVKPLMGIMCIAVLMGCIGNLMATFITVFGGYGLLNVLGVYQGMSLRTIFVCVIFFAVLRGILRYAEQACNHYIAFKLLARIRHKVFAALRKLAPAKLEGAERGNLISVITSDIELLEVFYAHTISPVCIAVITGIFMSVFIGSKHILLGSMAVIFYLIVGAVIPMMNGRSGSEKGQDYRNSFGSLNTTVLDNLYGLEEILQYGQEEKRLCKMQEQTARLEKLNNQLKQGENRQKVITDSVILTAGIVMTVLSGILVNRGELDFTEAVIAVIATMSSFGPTAALSALSNNLQHTLASGNRVLDLLEEEPVTVDVTDGKEECGGKIVCNGITFGYEAGAPKILNDFHSEFAEHKIHGILGKSGCGKSTLLKLLMRFFETENGKILYGENDVNTIKTESEQNRCAMACQGCGAVFLLFLK